MRIFRSWRSLWVFVFLVFAGALAGQAQPHRITDFNRGRTRSLSTPLPEAGTERDGVLYLPARDLQHGYELWRTDGTPEGTGRLTDLCPGLCDGASWTLGLFQGWLYFLGNDSEHGTEIWRTDGTAGGEELVADVCPGSCSPLLDGWSVWRGQIWFLAQKSYDAIPVLWTSDGTRAGTRPVASLCRKLSICDFGPYTSAFLAGPDPSGQGLVVRVFESYEAKSLYRTDGTAGGTVLLHRFADQGSGYAEAATVPLYFLDGSDLWTSDGTPSGTHFVRSLNGLVDFVPLRSSTRVIDGILYIAFDGGEWLRSDGTAEGTVVLANVGPGSNPTVERIGNSVFAVAEEGIWRTGGSPETTTRIAWPFGLIQTAVESAGRLFGLSYGPGGSGAAVWTTDGTLAGTRKIHFDGGPEPDSYVIAAFGNGALISRGARELWRIDGASSGGERLHAFEPENGGSGPTDQIVLGGRLLFLALANPTSRQLFSSDGTAAGTTAILATARNPYAEIGATYDPAYSSLTRAGTRAFFNARGRVWSSDGTREGTRIWHPNPSYAGFRMTAPIGLFGDQFVFSGILDLDSNPHRCSTGESEPWVSDGAHVMKRLLNLNPFHYEPYGICENVDLSSAPGRGVPLGRIALFAADDHIHGRELFATDGTAAGTRLVADINRKQRPIDDPELMPRPPRLIGLGSDPENLVRAGSRIFFTADDGETGRELWVTDGSYRGTRRVADLTPGPGSSSPRNLVAVGDAIYFFAAHGTADGLYRSDGTPGGTVLVSDLAGVSQARDLLAATNGRLFFAAFTEAAGTELWTSQGTAETTHLVADLRPGPRGSSPQRLKGLGDRVIFAADDGIAGLEPWRSDGTPEGTFRMGDLAPGAAASSPGPFSVANGQLLFGADDGEHGRELWAVPLADLHE